MPFFPIVLPDFNKKEYFIQPAEDDEATTNELQDDTNVQVDVAAEKETEKVAANPSGEVS